MTDDDELLDRRFDPRFQRGFDPERDADAVAAAPAPRPAVESPFQRPARDAADASTASPPAAAPPRPAASIELPAFVSAPRTAPVLPRVEAPGRPVPPGASAPGADGDADDTLRDESRFREPPRLPPRRNPFDIALLALSLALLAAAALVLWYGSGRQAATGGPDTDWLTDILVEDGPGILLTGGGMGLVLWIAIRALRLFRADEADQTEAGAGAGEDAVAREPGEPGDGR